LFAQSYGWAKQDVQALTPQETSELKKLIMQREIKKKQHVEAKRAVR
jgi:hypothetical protein